MKKINNIFKISLLSFVISGCALENNLSNSVSSSKISTNTVTNNSVLENSSSKEITLSTHYKGNYYNNVDLTLVDSALKTELRDLITETHTYQVSYGELRYSSKGLSRSDASLTDSSKIVCIYSREEVDGAWDSGKTWNREHVWPQSEAEGWFNGIDNGNRNAGSDLHHVRPEKPNVNTSRGNKAFANSTTNKTYEPVDAAKGDVARILFYMFTRYTETDSKSITSVAASWEMLLDWNELDPVDELEMQRNDVGEEVQGNRNPFIDYPELAYSIWG